MKKLFILLGTIETLCIIAIGYLYFAPLYPSMPVYGNILEYGEIVVSVCLSIWAIFVVAEVVMAIRNTKKSKKLVGDLMTDNVALTEVISKATLDISALIKNVAEKDENIDIKHREIAYLNRCIETREEVNKNLKDQLATAINDLAEYHRVAATSITSGLTPLPKEFILNIGIKKKIVKKKNTKKK